MGRLFELLADKVLGELLPLVPVRQVMVLFMLDGAMDEDKVAGWEVAGDDVLLGDMDNGDTESVSWDELGGDWNMEAWMEEVGLLSEVRAAQPEESMALVGKTGK